MHRYRLMGLGILAVVLGTAVAKSDYDVPVNKEQRLGTVQGERALAEIKSQGSSLPDGVNITLNGVAIGADTENSFYGFEAAYPDASRARLVLLEMATGGSGCPAFYRVIDIPVEGRPMVSESFGSCFEFAAPSRCGLVRENPVYRDGAWHIGIGSVAVTGMVDWWVYRDGAVTEPDPKRRSSCN